jgi:hypothetical protein
MFPGLFSVRRNFLLSVAERTDRHPHLGVIQKAEFSKNKLFNRRCFWKVTILISLFKLSILMKYSAGFQAISSDSLKVWGFVWLLPLERKLKSYQPN